MNPFYAIAILRRRPGYSASATFYLVDASLVTLENLCRQPYVNPNFGAYVEANGIAMSEAELDYRLMTNSLNPCVGMFSYVVS